MMAASYEEMSALDAAFWWYSCWHCCSEHWKLTAKSRELCSRW